MNYIEVDLEVAQDLGEILMAELAEIGFFTFEEYEQGVKGYINFDDFNVENLSDVIDKYRPSFPIQYKITEIEKKNWNEEWEKSFNPIEIKGVCIVRASFHESRPEFLHEIIINPKMSFGTGHHSTTSLMLEFLLEINNKDKTVADIGCGTGILAIMSSKLGAKELVGMDIEEWTVENAKENVILNECKNIEILEGKLAENNIGSSFDIILANINKNVLLEEIPQYTNILSPKGILLLSGFYEEDIIDIEKKAAQSGLEKIEYKVKNQWAAVLFKNQ